MKEDTRTEEEKARSKRTHALVMIILGAIMAACALAAGLIAMSPGVFPSWMTGSPRRAEPYRSPRPTLVKFADFDLNALARARADKRLVLLHLAPAWSSEARLMEETTYADAQTADWIAARLVAVRADAEERPDLALTYGVGAWPSIVLLLPDGRALAAASRLTPKLFLPWATLIADCLRDDAAKAEALAVDAGRRFSAVHGRPAPSAGPDDPVWGGAYHSPREHAKVLAEQAAVVASSDAPRAKAVLTFVENFLSLPGGGYAASTRGEVELADGRIEEGSAYFAKDDAARRADGLPKIDRRIFSGPNAEMVAATLKSPVATTAQKDHARRTLDFLWTRLVRDGRVAHSAGGIYGWSEDQKAMIEAELAAGRSDRARALGPVNQPRRRSSRPTILKDGLSI